MKIVKNENGLAIYYPNGVLKIVAKTIATSKHYNEFIELPIVAIVTHYRRWFT